MLDLEAPRGHTDERIRTDFGHQPEVTIAAPCHIVAEPFRTLLQPDIEGSPAFGIEAEQDDV